MSDGKQQPEAADSDNDNGVAPPAAPVQGGEVRRHVDSSKIRQFVTHIKSAVRQVGEHIIEALADDSTVAVLTTVVIGPDGGQRIVSAGLDPEMMLEVQKILLNAQEEREEEIPCVGFHCYLKNRPDGEKKSKGSD